MKTVTFVYTQGISYKATNVNEINSDGYTVDYTRQVQNESGTVVGGDFRSVSTEDLLYAIVKDHSTGIVSIIPGIYDNFDVVPKGNAVTRQENIDREAEDVAYARALKAPERAAKEQAKFEARRLARKAAWEANNGTTEPTVPVERFQTAIDTRVTQKVSALSSAVEQLILAGVSESDIEVLKSLNVLK